MLKYQYLEEKSFGVGAILYYRTIMLNSIGPELLRIVDKKVVWLMCLTIEADLLLKLDGNIRSSSLSKNLSGYSFQNLSLWYLPHVKGRWAGVRETTYDWNEIICLGPQMKRRDRKRTSKMCNLVRERTEHAIVWIECGFLGELGPRIVIIFL